MPTTGLPVKKAPCKECPFRKDAIPGWLGGEEDQLASDYLRLAHSDENVVCHTSVGYAEHNVATLRPCAGLAIYRNNVCKKSRDPQAAEAQEFVGKEHKADVFASPKEFLDRHDTPLNRSFAARSGVRPSMREESV